MNNKTFKAQITVMAALSMTIIFSLICTCVRSALDCFYNTQIKEACMLSVEGAFSAYHNDMLSEYDILLLQYSDNIKARIEQYAEENIYSCGKNVSLMGVDVDNIEYITDQGGIYLRKEIASYMQYGLFSEMADVMRQSEKELQKVEKIKEITSDIQDCEKDLWEVDLKILQLIKYVEGIETTDTGIVIRRGEPVSSGGYFAKSAVNGIVSRDSVYVDEKKVYMSIDNSEPGYTDVSALLDDMYEDASGVAASEENQKEEDYINSYSDVYRRNYIKLKAVLGGTKEQTEKALEVLGEYDDAKSGAENKLGGCMEKVSAEIKTLGEELCNELIEDLKSMKEDNASDKKTMCDMQQLRQALSRNLIVLNGVCSQIEKLEENLNYDNSRDVMSPDGILFSVCDQPKLKISTIQRILNDAALHKKNVICAGYRGQKGNPVLWPAHCFAELLELTGDEGGRQMLTKYEEKVRIIETSREELKDIDSKRDLENLGKETEENKKA